MRMFITMSTLLFLASLAPAQDFAKQGQPGPEHDKLRSFVGTWELTTETGKEKGKAEYKPILGGRFVTEEVKLPVGGFTMEWFGIYGYDKTKKKHTAVWVDNMDTSTESAEADADASGRVLSFKGEHIDSRTGRMSPYVWRITRQSDTEFTIDMFETDKEGKERQVFSVKAEKVK
jgi:hypothetical protein